MARRQKKQKNYVFPEYERSRLGIALGIDAFQVLFFGPLYMAILFDYKTSAHQKTMLLAWGIIAAVLMIIPLLYGLKDYPRRSARYAFGGDSVSILLGKTRRSLSTGDAVHIARRILRFGETGSEVEQSFFVLWKENVELPAGVLHPYRALKNHPILVLPDNDEVCRQLSALFGDREELRQNDRECSTNYVFSEYERERFKLGMGLTPLISIFFLGVYFSLLRDYLGKSDLIIITVFWGTFVAAWILLLRVSMKYKRHRFARYRFSEDAVFMRFGETEWGIHASDSFQISLRTMIFPERYNIRKEKYITLWRTGEPEPKDEVSPYSIMKRSEVIILPDTEDVRNQLRRTLGVKVIGYWVSSPTES